MTPARKALAAVILAVILFVAVVGQLTVVNRLPLPGGAVPDLVLLLVTAIAVIITPARAAIVGFVSGLALDVAPPAAHQAGEYALVFCLAAYAASRVNQAISDRAGERDPMTSFTVMVGATIAGEAGKAALGILLSDPNVTTAAVSRVLPGAVLYDLVLSPLAFLLVARVTRGPAPERAAAGEFGRDQRTAPFFPGLGSRDPVFRLASAGAVPKLHLAGTGARYGSAPSARRPTNRRNLRFAGTGKDYRVPSVTSRVPKLRPSRAGSPASSAVHGSAGRLTAPRPSGRARKLSFSGDLPSRAPVRPGRTPGKNWLRASAPPAPGTGSRAGQRQARGPARGWLKSGTGRRAGSPRAAVRQPRTASEAFAARSAPSGLSALAGPGTPLVRRRGPQAGWLRGGRNASLPAVRKHPRTGWLGSSHGRPRTVIGSTVRGRTVFQTGTSSPRGTVFHRGTAFRKGTVLRKGPVFRNGPVFRKGTVFRRGTDRWAGRAQRTSPSLRGGPFRRRRGYLRGGRPSGARPMARTATVPGARGVRLFRVRRPRLAWLIGGRR